MALVAGALAFTALSTSACGGGGPRQDESEPAGKFPLEITTSQFPTRQRLAESAMLRLGVENTGERAIPDVAITISIDENAIRPFSVRDPQPNLAAPDRPVWVLEHDYPRLVGEPTTAGAKTANEKTFSFGSLEPGKSVEAEWKVTPVRSGTYTLDYQVDAGLTGKAKAVTADGNPPTGSFVVQITAEPPQTRVNDQGEVVVIPGQGGGSSSGGKSKDGSQGSPQGSSQSGGAALEVTPAG
jgi:hypothetical protein